ncbi:MAG: hypothetical protein HKN82_16365 [Akkermansiaceae bacterium]|nr:hypothetical protein [Akkermansiaceae bacterium]
MWKLVLLVSLLPTVVAVIFRKGLCDRVLVKSRAGVTNQTGRELAKSVLRRAKAEEEVSIVEKRRAGVSLQPAELRLSKDLAEGRGVLALGEVALMCGESIVAARQPDLLKWRQWAVRFGWAFPAFTMVVVVFAIVVGKVPAMWGISIVVAALGIASGILLASLTVMREAAGMAARVVEDSAALPRGADREEVAQVCRALAYRRVVPGAIDWLMGSPRGADGRKESRARIEG